ncbi:glycosyltransferase family 2 protein, partial [Enterococcus malodoratus]
MSTPFFSIILPVYNVERYLERSINSIKNQIEQNFEVILINDGSTDNSENKILDLIANDNRFSLINKDNEGSGPARNDGLRLAEGNYIYFMDPDDEIKKNLLDDCKKTLEKTQSDILMFGYEGIDIVNEKRYIISNDNYYLLKNQTDFRNEFKRILFGNSFNAVWNKMYKLEWLQSTGVYFPRMINAEDGKFNSDLLPYISSFEIIPKSYYIYYISRPDSIMTRYNEKFLDNELILINCFESSIRVWENYREFRSYINN